MIIVISDFVYVLAVINYCHMPQNMPRIQDGKTNIKKEEKIVANYSY